MRTSYSSLSTYQQCPLKYKFQEIDRIRVPKGLEAIFGNIVHNCLKFMFEHTPLYPTLDEIINRFSNLWQDKELPEIRPEEEKAYYEDGISILKNFYRLNRPWNFDVLDLESRFEVLIPDPNTQENHILAGIIDRIDKISDGNFEIIDYKTSRRMPAQDTLDKDLQMSIYHLGILKRWPHFKPENIKLSLYFLKHRRKNHDYPLSGRFGKNKKFRYRSYQRNKKQNRKKRFSRLPLPSLRLVRLSADVPDVETRV